MVISADDWCVWYWDSDTRLTTKTSSWILASQMSPRTARFLSTHSSLGICCRERTRENLRKRESESKSVTREEGGHGCTTTREQVFTEDHSQLPSFCIIPPLFMCLWHYHWLDYRHQLFHTFCCSLPIWTHRLSSSSNSYYKSRHSCASLYCGNNL